jgi:hypothetical protein
MIPEVLNMLNYCLSLPKNLIFHASLLLPYKENNIHEEIFTEPPPDLIEGEFEYEVELIVSQKSGNGLAYLVKCKCYSTGENTWEPEQKLEHTSNSSNL